MLHLLILLILLPLCRRLGSKSNAIPKTRRSYACQGFEWQPRHSKMPSEAWSYGKPVHLRCGSRKLRRDCYTPPRLLRSPAVCRSCLYRAATKAGNGNSKECFPIVTRSVWKLCSPIHPGAVIPTGFISCKDTYSYTFLSFFVAFIGA